MLHSDAMLSFWVIAGWTTLGGCVGGLLYLISALLPKVAAGSAAAATPEKDSEPPSAVLRLKRATWGTWLSHMGIGVGGSWATMLAAVWAKRAPFTNDLDSHLGLIGTAVIGGFAGSRILPAVADRLTRELLEKAVQESQASADSAEDSKQSAEDAKRKAESAQRQVEAERRKAELVGKAAEANAYLSSDRRSAADTIRYIGVLAAAMDEMPTVRQVAWALTWLHVENGNFDEAVKTLEAFISAKNAVGQGKSKDVADAYWNIAYCQVTRSQPSEENLASAKSALENSIAIEPEYRAAVLENPEYRRLLDPTFKDAEEGDATQGAEAIEDQEASDAEEQTANGRDA
jgi:hypothetical protein